MKAPASTLMLRFQPFWGSVVLGVPPLGLLCLHSAHVSVDPNAAVPAPLGVRLSGVLLPGLLCLHI